MAKKIYVGNISYKTTEEDLMAKFGEFGEVLSAKILTDETGRSRGFGFVEMASDGDAEKAISSLNGVSFMGRELVVNEARPRPERPRPGGRGGFGRER